MSKAFLISAILTLCAVFASAEEVVVELSQKEVGINESFSVVFTSQDQLRSNPDFSPLNEDFAVISKSQSHQTFITNGKVDQEIRWNLVLIPKREGVLTIPALSFGDSRSSPMTIEVKEATSPQQEESLFLETSVEPEEGAYEQSEIIYTVRLFRSVNVSQASLSDVEVSDPDALIEKLGEDIVYEHQHSNGKQYLVLERKYAVFPQKAGELVFSPTVFEGRVVTVGNSFFNRQFPYKRVFSPEEKIVVKPVPPPFQKHNWFAAKDVLFTSEWSSDPNAAVVGEPITLTLTIAAEGSLGSMIPDFEFSWPKGLKHYLDKPQISNHIQDEEIVGVKQIKVALIPSEVGTVPIPEMQLKWWDLHSDQMEIAKLPEVSLVVHHGEAARNESLIEEPTNSPSVEEIKLNDNHPLPFWAWFLIGLNGIWVVGLIVLLAKRTQIKIPQRESSSSVRGRLKRACQSDDAKQTEALLLAWAAETFPEAKALTLMDISKNLSDDLRRAVIDLYQALYGRHEAWSGEALWNAFSHFNPQKKESSKEAKKEKILRELYPRS